MSNVVGCSPARLVRYAARAAILLMLTGLVTCSRPSLAYTPAPEVPVWRVTTPSGQTSVLIGTMHVAHPALLQPSPSLFDHAKQSVVEHHADERFILDVAPEVAQAAAMGRSVHANWAANITDQFLATMLRDLNCAAR